MAMQSRDELKTILENFGGFTADMLYDDLIIIPDKDSDFNKSEYNKFIVAYSLLNTNGLTADLLRKYIASIGKVGEEKLERMKNNLLSNFPDWVGMSSPNSDTSKNHIKFYLSVDNSSLHAFGVNFLQECLDKGLQDFDFKINNNGKVNRRDNVVIYCNEDNIGSYYDAIKDTMSKNPGIKLNAPHLLGIRCNDYIYCGTDYENGQVSYTDNVCKMIFKSLNNQSSPDEIADRIEEFKDKKGPEIFALMDHCNRKNKR